MNGSIIFPRNNIKYLGVFIDEYLDGNDHLMSIESKLQRSISIISKMKTFCDKKDLLTLYYSTFHPHILYGLQVWGHTSKSNIDKIKKLQNIAVRIITGCNKYEHITCYYKDLKLLKFEDNLFLNHDYN